MIFPVPMLGKRKASISSSYRSRDRPSHKGVDIMYRRRPEDGGPPGQTQLPTHSRRYFMPPGIPALAALPGVVKTSKEIGTGGYVVIDHPEGWQTQYMHLRNRRVKVGDKVKAGQSIADVHHGPEYALIHLHFQMRKGGQLRDPEPLLQDAKHVTKPRAWLVAALLMVIGVGGLVYLFRDRRFLSA